MAVDSAMMVIDCAKGIEPQTLKLFKVCRMKEFLHSLINWTAR